MVSKTIDRGSNPRGPANIAGFYKAIGRFFAFGGQGFFTCRQASTPAGKKTRCLKDQRGLAIIVTKAWSRNIGNEAPTDHLELTC